MGLLVDEDFALDNLSRIAEHAQRNADPFVRVDMEGSAVTEATLRVFERAFERYKNVGIVLQAYLKRTPQDVARAIELGARVRLCKGAYNEPPEIAYKHMQEIREQYVTLPARVARERSLSGHRHARSPPHSGCEGDCRRRKDFHRPVRVSNAARLPSARSARIGRARVSHARVRAVWNALGGILLPPRARTPRERFLRHFFDVLALGVRGCGRSCNGFAARPFGSAIASPARSKRGFWSWSASASTTTIATRAGWPKKSRRLRIFRDDDDLMNRSVTDEGGAILLVSQFTLHGDVAKGGDRRSLPRPKADTARHLYERVGEELAARGLRVEYGEFGADMDVELVNRGPSRSCSTHKRLF